MRERQRGLLWPSGMMPVYGGLERLAGIIDVINELFSGSIVWSVSTIIFIQRLCSSLLLCVCVFFCFLSFVYLLTGSVFLIGCLSLC